jgi:hypothetical protein
MKQIFIVVCILSQTVWAYFGSSGYGYDDVGQDYWGLNVAKGTADYYLKGSEQKTENLKKASATTVGIYNVFVIDVEEVSFYKIGLSFDYSTLAPDDTSEPNYWMAAAQLFGAFTWRELNHELRPLHLTPYIGFAVGTVFESDKLEDTSNTFGGIIGCDYRHENWLIGLELKEDGGTGVSRSGLNFHVGYRF